MALTAKSNGAVVSTSSSQPVSVAVIGRTDILFVQHAERIGGSSFSLYLLIEDAIAQGWRVRLIVPNRGMVNYYAKLLPQDQITILKLACFHHHNSYRVRLVPRDIARFALNVVRFLPTSLALMLEVRRVTPAIVHLNTSLFIPYLLPLAFAPAARIVHIREQIANGTLGFRRKVLRHLCQCLASHVLFIGQREQASLTLSPGKGTVAYNYVREKTFQNFRPRTAAELRERSIRILSLGGLSKIKGGEELSRLAAEIGTFAEVRLVGVFPHDMPKGNIAAEILPPTADVIPHLEWADVLVFWTSTPHFPRPVFEAWLARRIVIVSACINGDSGIGEDSAIVGRDQSYESLRAAVQQVVDSPEDALSRSEKGFALATECFTDRNFETIAQVLRKFMRKAA